MYQFNVIEVTKHEDINEIENCINSIMSKLITGEFEKIANYF